jgi:hypothetical protein
MSVVNSTNELSKVAAPNLPLAPVQYDSRYQEQLNNVLRLYFNRLDNLIGQLSTDVSSGDFTTLTAQTEVLKGTGQNFFTYSQTFTNAIWLSANTSVTANTTVAPNGTVTASTLTVTASLASLFKQNVTVIAGQTYTFSFYVLRGTATDMRYSVYNNTASAEIIVSTSYYASTNSTTWSRISVTFTTPAGCTNIGVYPNRDSLGTGNFYLWGAQLEVGPTTNTYIPTTATAIYGTPNLSFSGVANIGLQSDGSLFVQPAGTGALQAQATTSTAVGGNARGTNAVDWQTARSSASQVAASVSVIGGGSNNTASNYGCTVAGGEVNTNAAYNGFIGGGSSNSLGGLASRSVIAGGVSNTANGLLNFIGGGAINSGTSGSAAATQSATMNGTTAVTLSAPNAAIRVGQLIAGTSIQQFPYTYVSAISGTSLTLSQNASGSSTNNISFYTPHGVVVGGGNNQATGSYSYIGGGGDAGTAANRNVASGDWSAVVGGRNNTASGALGAFVGGGFGHSATNVGSVVCGGGFYGASPTSFAGNLSSGASSFIGAGYQNNNSGGYASAIVGGATNSSGGNFAFVGAGNGNAANANNAAIMGGAFGIARGIEGNHIFPACNFPIASVQGVSQVGLIILGTQTTDATATVLRSNSSAAGTNNQVILPNNSAYFFTGEVVAGVTGGGNSKSWTIEGLIKRGANAAATTLVGSTVTSPFGDAGAAGWVIAVTADTTNGGLAVTFTGQLATTIRTVCQIRTTEMTY